MGLRWKGIPVGVKKRLEAELLLTRDNGRKSDFSNNSFTTLLRGCVLINYRWQFTKYSKTKDIILSLFCQTFRVDNEEWLVGQLASCVYDIAKIELKWNNLTKEVQETIFQGIEARSGSCNSLSALLHG
jgi:hypothetical protein